MHICNAISACVARPTRHLPKRKRFWGVFDATTIAFSALNGRNARMAADFTCLSNPMPIAQKAGNCRIRVEITPRTPS
jgi:hypothetical protein